LDPKGGPKAGLLLNRSHGWSIVPEDRENPKNTEASSMRIAIVSDIHDDVARLRAALGGLSDVDELICLGDLCSPFVVKEFGVGFTGPVHIVFGNNDGDRYRIAEVARKYPHVKIHGEYADLEIGGRKFSVNHFDNIGKAIAAGGQYDVVCYGHSHRFGVEKHGRVTVVNPGEIFGVLTGESTYAVYDTRTGEVERVGITLKK
jgi:putative phosphoesterase